MRFFTNTKYTTRLLLIGLASLLCVCTQSMADTKTTFIKANVGFVDISSYPFSSTNINPMRLKALRETAIHLGATGALAWRSIQINYSLQKEQYYLDHVFDFNRLLLANHVLPPVITQANNSLHVADTTTIRGDSKTYTLLAPARFVSTAPTWRDYLDMNYQKPKLPDHTLLPQSRAEAIAWNMYIRQGWKQGIEQADAIFEENLNRLKLAYSGMVLYKKLLAEHMVSAPNIAQSNLGITGNTHEIRINDHIARITNPAKLQPNSRRWTPIFTQ